MPVVNIRERKKELRAKHKRFRKSCPPDIKLAMDRKLTESFLSLEEYQACQTLFTFVSSPIECDTSQIIAEALREGKRVAVPKCTSKRGEMDFYFIESRDDLQPGYYGIREPSPEKCEKATDISQGVCLVPGLAFDYQGYRLGYGGGYYDRFLERFGGTTVGICYSKCVENELPRGAFDRQTDILITEKFINRTT